VDGTVDHLRRERGLAHVARCDSCRAEVDAQRRLKAALGSLPAPTVSVTFVARLHLIAAVEIAAVEPSLRPAGRRGSPGRPPGHPGRGLRTPLAPGRRPSLSWRGVTRSRRLVAATAGGVAVFALSLSAASAGAPPAPASVRTGGHSSVIQPLSRPGTAPAVATNASSSPLPARTPGGLPTPATTRLAGVATVRDEEFAGR
jgi:hypothetical protein